MIAICRKLYNFFAPRMPSKAFVETMPDYPLPIYKEVAKTLPDASKEEIESVVRQIYMAPLIKHMYLGLGSSPLPPTHWYQLQEYDYGPSPYSKYVMTQQLAKCCKENDLHSLAQLVLYIVQERARLSPQLHSIITTYPEFESVRALYKKLVLVS